jgi:hypothetical protein
MKPQEMKPETVYRIVDRSSGEFTGSYSRSYCDEYDFESVSEARSANVHDMFKDVVKYGVNKYKVTYELLEEDCE